MSEKPIWKHISEIREKTSDYIRKRKDGTIKSVRTPWRKLNNCLLDGLEWGSLMILAARPGAGKTAMAEQICNEVRIHNPDQDIAVLKFQFEMSEIMTGARELTSKLGLSIKELLSEDPTGVFAAEQLKYIQEYNEANKNDCIYQISQARTAREIRKDSLEFYKTVQKPFIGMIDHSILTRKAVDEKDQLESLYALSREIVWLKNNLPNSIWIILTQMNRGLEDAARREPGKIANFPTSADIFGAENKHWLLIKFIPIT